VSPGLLRRLPSLIRWADVVHLTATYSFPTLPTLFFCRLMGKPVVWSPRGAILDAYDWAGAPRKRLKRIWEWCCNALIPRGRVIAHVTSDKEREAVEVRVPRAKGVIVPNGVDVPVALPNREWQPDGRLRLMFLGRISPKKGIENLLSALRMLNAPDITLTIYGTGPADYEVSIRRLAADLEGPGGTVSFAGHVSGEGKAQAFRTADVCVVPSFSENFCMVVAEALAHGVPVIASHGTPWSCVEEKQCGMWVDNNPEALAQAIAAIRSMPLTEMGRRGWEWMRGEYSWNSVAAECSCISKARCKRERGGMNKNNGISDYGWRDSAAKESQGYLAGPIRSVLLNLGVKRVLDLGCGNGAMAHWLQSHGFDVTGCDVDGGGGCTRRFRQIGCHIQAGWRL